MTRRRGITPSRLDFDEARYDAGGCVKEPARYRSPMVIARARLKRRRRGDSGKSAFPF